MLWTKVKLDKKTRKLWYLLVHTFWLLMPRFNFWKGDWALGYDSIQILDFANVSSFPKILSIGSYSKFVILNIKYHVSFYLWHLRPLPKHKVIKCYDQNFFLFFFLFFFAFCCCCCCFVFCFFFALYTSIDDSTFWEKSSFGSKMLLTINKQSWKLSKVKFWPKPNIH